MAWKNPPKNFTAKILKDADTMTKKIVSQIFQGVVIRSPVDTGQFRGNWKIGISTYSTKFDEGVADVSGTGAINKAIATINSNTLNGKIIYVVNNAPYAKRLNDGWSQQAPINFVELTIQSVVNKYK